MSAKINFLNDLSLILLKETHKVVRLGLEEFSLDYQIGLCLCRLYRKLILVVRFGNITLDLLNWKY